MTTRTATGGRHARRSGRIAWTPSIRSVALFSRARNGSALAVGAVAVALLAWGAAEWITRQPESAGPIDRLQVAMLAPLAATVLVSTTLFAADEELERTGAWAWPRVRLVHAIVVTAGVAAVLAVTGLEDSRVYGAFELARNTLACAGIVLLAAPVIGGRLAWAPALGYVATVYVVAPRDPTTGWWTWPVQLAESTSAWKAAVAWFVVGAAAYAWKGSRARRFDDA